MAPRVPRTLRRASAGRLQDIALEELTIGGRQPKRVVHQDSIPRGADVRPLKDGWWIAKIVIRSISLVFASALVILQIHVVATDGYGYWGPTNTDFLACIIPVRLVVVLSLYLRCYSSLFVVVWSVLDLICATFH